MKRIVYFLLPLSLAFVTSSCGLITSDTRSLKLVIKNYENLLTAGNFDKATAMCDSKDFLWIQDIGEDKVPVKKTKVGRRTKPLKGIRAAKAFHKSIATLEGQDKVMVDIGKIAELKPGVFTVIGFMQVRQLESGALRSIKWKMTMKWIKVQGGWRMKELKERGPRKNFRS